MGVSILIILGILAILLFYVVAIYNRLVALKNRLDNAFGQIEVQLKRRYDLIPSLLETVKAYLKHESETLEKVVKARSGAMASLEEVAKNPTNARAMEGFIKSESALQNALSGLNITVEAYPDLKASANMQQFSEELSSTENKIAFARQAFNDAVMTYNTYKQSFPPVIFASSFGHGNDAKILEFESSIQEPPKVSF